MRMTMGVLAVGGGCPGDSDAASVGGGPVEGFDIGGVVDGENCGNARVSKAAEATAHVGLPVGRGEAGRGVVEEDSDLSLEVKVGGWHSVAEEDHGRFDERRLVREGLW